MATTQHYTAVSIFDTPDQARAVIEELRRAGFRDEQIGIAVPRGVRDRADGSTAARYGALVGRARGALAGIAASLGVLPAVRPVIATELLAGSVDGDGLVDALVRLGVPEEEAHYYESEFRAGRTIVTVKE